MHKNFLNFQKIFDSYYNFLIYLNFLNMSHFLNFQHFFHLFDELSLKDIF